MLAAIDLGTISAFILAMGAVSFLLIILLLLFIARVLGTLIRLLESSRPGKRISAERSGPHPLTNFSRNGVPSDPLNVKIIATPGQLATAFAAAGWYRADEIALITSIR
ncbi:MAG TPA: LssY C-terminal domain-containing protein, partial [Ktedonobacterales bacterium]|nr:LssY C-terminal domain-containing protein [Ktedonobacterales bacterium]